MFLTDFVNTYFTVVTDTSSLMIATIMQQKLDQKQDEANLMQMMIFLSSQC